MKTLFLIVNYKNSSLTIDCVSSIVKQRTNSNQIEIAIADNSCCSKSLKELRSIETDYIKVYDTKGNLGYFGGMNFLLTNYSTKEYDYTIICNNDLIFNEEFLQRLSLKNYQPDYFAICPNIVTMDGVHQNPHERHPISWQRKFLYSLYFKNYLLGTIMFKMQQVIKGIRNKPNRVESYETPGEIFLGYGAIYILTESFWNKNSNLNYPHFLMGEEVYLAHQISQTGGKIFYDPALNVKHLEHASVDHLPSKQMYNITKESFKGYRTIWNKITYKEGNSHV